MGLLRHFHKNKAINSALGEEIQQSLIIVGVIHYGKMSNLSTITSVAYRGTTTSLSGTDSEKKAILEDNGVPVPVHISYRVPARNAAVDADVQDAINDGVIVISSAGNSYGIVILLVVMIIITLIILHSQDIIQEVQHQDQQIMLLCRSMVLKLLNINLTSVIGVPE